VKEDIVKTLINPIGVVLQKHVVAISTMMGTALAGTLWKVAALQAMPAQLAISKTTDFSRLSR